VLLVRGELTTPYFKRIVEEQSSCLPQAKTATIPKAGHASPLLNPPAFKETVTGFLKP
jgi:pimeloyl-ACP methyl ester carboxylesterase